MPDFTEYYHKNRGMLLSKLNFEIVFHLKHPNDNSNFNIKFNMKYDINVVFNFLEIINKNSNSRLSKTNMIINEINQTNSNIYGKISIEILNINIKSNVGSILANISLNPYSFFLYDSIAFSMLSLLH